MKGRFLIIAILVIVLCISGVSAIDGGYLDDSTQTIHDWYNLTIYKQGTSGSFFGTEWGSASRLRINNIQNYDDIYLFKIDMLKDANHIVSGSGGTFQAYSGARLVMSGDVFAWEATPTVYSIQFEPDYFSRGALSGTVELTLNLYGISITSNAKRNPGTSPIDLGHSVDSGKVIEILSSQAWGWGQYYTKINRYGITSDEDNCLYIQRFDFTRQKPDGSWTYSHINLTEYDESIIYHDSSSGSANVYNVSTLTAPLKLIIEYGSPVVATHTYTWEGSSTCAPITPTPTPTATPTPGTDLCQYWSLSLNTSNINRNEAVLGTLTETDPEDRYDMIDWYRVLPNGAEYITKHYIYDSGLFGLGAGWFLVDSYTGYTEASSVDEALENEIDFTTSGGAHYVRVRIYDDKSLLPLVYHDYDHVCTKEAIVYVGETTQSLTQQGINVYEADTNAFLSDVSLSVYDYGSGEWQNKTSTYGSTTYFNAVPGHSMRVLANKTGWLSSDSTFTVANPPVPYAVYLKRPLPDIVNKSYAFFNVRDSVTHTGLYQATIQLSDGQLQSTLPSGYAGFSVNDSESYYYTVSKPGYQTLTSTFSISEDTTIPVLLVQIAPTPTVTLPITTLPTVTVTGTLTPTVTGTTTLTATATGTYSNATLAAAERVQKTTKAVDVWYTNAETLSNLLFLAVIVGVLGLMSNAMDKRRRRR